MEISVKCKQCNCDFLKCSYEITRSEKLGYKNHFCSNKCCVKYNNNIHRDILPKKHREEYYKNPKLCLYCNSIIPYEKKNSNLNYCSRRCAAIHTQKDGGHCKWDEKGKQYLRELSKKNPYFNGTIQSPRRGNGKNGLVSQRIISNKICPTCGLSFRPKKINQICCNRKCRNKWIIHSGYLKGKGLGGYREKGGRGKQGWYKGYYCSSSWELAWVIYQLEHGVKFKRNTEGFEYEFNGRKYKFYPDFQMDETNNYVEVKGYLDKKNTAKISSFPYQLNVIGRKEIKPFIEYTELKYGKDYTHLYETKKSS